MVVKLFRGVLLALTLAIITGHPTYPGGGPTCGGASGGHGAAAAGTNGGNTITATTTSPNIGEVVTVTLTGNFRGFLLKASGGSWSALPSEAQDWTCTGAAAVAHNSR